MLNKVEFRMAIPALTREYTPGSRRNSRNPMTHTNRRETSLDFPAFGAEQYSVLAPTGKETAIFLIEHQRVPKNTVTRRDEL